MTIPNSDYHYRIGDFVILLLIGLAMLACVSQKKSAKWTKDNASIVFNEVNSVSGVYAKSILAQRGEGEHAGHYKIVVNDTLEIALLPPYRAEAIRPKEEVARMEGKRVRVTGVVSKRTHMSKPSIDAQPLSVSMPCFTTIDSIELEK